MLGADPDGERVRSRMLAALHQADLLLAVESTTDLPVANHGIRHLCQTHLEFRIFHSIRFERKGAAGMHGNVPLGEDGLTPVVP